MTSAVLLLLIPVLLAFHSTLNIFLLRRPNEVHHFSGSVAVLVPLRNEAENIGGLIASLKSQIGIENLQFHLLDDNSTDATYDLALESITGDPRFTVHRGGVLPMDWLGKPFALHQALHFSTSEVVVTIDADVRLQPTAIANTITLMKERDFDFISAYPRQIAISWAERLIQPLLQWSWLTTVPLRIAEKSTNPAFAVANGQFFLVNRSALEVVGGFSAIKKEVIDDISLARVLLRHGFHGSVVDGSRIATCRMYNSWSELREGYGKSLHVAFGGWLGTSIAIAFLFISSVLPFILGLTGAWWGWYGYMAIVLSRVFSAYATRGRIRDSFFHPLSALLLIYLILRSWRMRGNTQWKGRVV